MLSDVNRVLSLRFHQDKIFVWMLQDKQYDVNDFGLFTSLFVVGRVAIKQSRDAIGYYYYYIFAS